MTFTDLVAFLVGFLASLYLVLRAAVWALT